MTFDNVFCIRIIPVAHINATGITISYTSSNSAICSSTSDGVIYKTLT